VLGDEREEVACFHATTLRGGGCRNMF